MARKRLAAIALFVVSGWALVALLPTRDPDFFWQILTGKLALGERSRLMTDPFSIEFRGAPWRYKDLAGDLILWIGFDRIGYAWLAVLKLATVATWAGALVLFLPARTPAAMIFGLGAQLYCVHLADRPNLFSEALFPLCLGLLERARRDPRALWPLVGVVYGWTLLHRGGLAGVALVLAFAVWSTATSRKFQKWPFVAFAAAALLALVNPFGVELVRSSFTVVSSPLLKRAISEWRTLELRDMLTLPAYVLGCVVLALSLSRRQAEKSWHTLLLIVFALAAWRSVRFAPYFGATAAMVGASLLAEVELSKVVAPLVALATLVACFVQRGGLPFTLGPDRDALPDRAIDFAEQHHLAGAIGNAYEFGGYALYRMWPRAHVLADGRLDTVYPLDYVEQVIRSEHDPALFSERIAPKVDWVLASNHPLRGTHRFLWRAPEWAAVFASDAATVYVRRVQHPDLEAFSVIDPSAPDHSVVQAMSHGAAPQAIARELERMVEASPTSLRFLCALALFDHLRGAFDARDRVLATLDALHPDAPAVPEFKRRMGVAGRSTR